jgi:hypothetical protein
MGEAAGGQMAARRPEELQEALAYGLTAGELSRWAAFSPIEIYWARKHRLSLGAARRWAGERVRVWDAVRAVALAMTVGEVRPWAEAGFAPSDAVEAREMGISLATAIAWREAGFILPDAALLIGDGWTLEEATRARHAPIGPYGSGVR